MLICGILSVLGFNTGKEADVALVATIYRTVAAAIDDYGALQELRHEAYGLLPSMDHAQPERLA